MIEQLDFPGPVEPTGADLRTVEGQLGRVQEVRRRSVVRLGRQPQAARDQVPRLEIVRQVDRAEIMAQRRTRRRRCCSRPIRSWARSLS